MNQNLGLGIHVYFGYNIINPIASKTTGEKGLFYFCLLYCFSVPLRLEEYQ